VVVCLGFFDKAQAQGTVHFTNLGPDGGLIAAINAPGGNSFKAGDGFSAQLFLSNGPPIGEPTGFSCCSIFDGGIRVFPSIPPGDEVEIYVGIEREGRISGRSDSFSIVLGGDETDSPAPRLTGLKGFDAFSKSLVSEITDSLPEEETEELVEHYLGPADISVTKEQFGIQGDKADVYFSGNVDGKFTKIGTTADDLTVNTSGEQGFFKLVEHDETIPLPLVPSDDLSITSSFVWKDIEGDVNVLPFERTYTVSSNNLGIRHQSDLMVAEQYVLLFSREEESFLVVDGVLMNTGVHFGDSQVHQIIAGELTPLNDLPGGKFQFALYSGAGAVVLDTAGNLVNYSRISEAKEYDNPQRVYSFNPMLLENVFPDKVYFSGGSKSKENLAKVNKYGAEIVGKLVETVKEGSDISYGRIAVAMATTERGKLRGGLVFDVFDNPGDTPENRVDSNLTIHYANQTPGLSTIVAAYATDPGVKPFDLSVNRDQIDYQVVMGDRIDSDNSFHLLVAQYQAGLGSQDINLKRNVHRVEIIGPPYLQALAVYENLTSDSLVNNSESPLFSAASIRLTKELFGIQGDKADIYFSSKVGGEFTKVGTTTEELRLKTSGEQGFFKLVDHNESAPLSLVPSDDISITSSFVWKDIEGDVNVLPFERTYTVSSNSLGIRPQKDSVSTEQYVLHFSKGENSFLVVDGALWNSGVHFEDSQVYQIVAGELIPLNDLPGGKLEAALYSGSGYVVLDTAGNLTNYSKISEDKEYYSPAHLITFNAQRVGTEKYHGLFFPGVGSSNETIIGFPNFGLEFLEATIITDSITERNVDLSYDVISSSRSDSERIREGLVFGIFDNPIDTPESRRGSNLTLHYDNETLGLSTIVAAYSSDHGLKPFALSINGSKIEYEVVLGDKIDKNHSYHILWATSEVKEGHQEINLKRVVHNDEIKGEPQLQSLSVYESP
jgi:hypothetical protein